MKYGLLGYPLSHSFSKSYFDKKFEEPQFAGNEYINLELDNLLELRSIVLDLKLDGFNITIPYKQKIIPCLNQIESNAAAMNAVNVVKIQDGKWSGYNTDYVGFVMSIGPIIQPAVNALILGSGGAANAVAYGLKTMGIPYLIVSRSNGFGYQDITQNIIKTHQLIINTTPLGMFPNINDAPSIPYEHLTDRHLCYDLVYNPPKSLFLSKSESSGAQIKNGLEMLELQAELSWDIWTSISSE